MSQQGQFMLLFSLGPVQTFIVQARKTRDMWLGSLLLSKLMEAAMDGLKGEFVFPSTRKVEDIPDIPNKYIAIYNDLSEAQAAAAQSKRQIAKRWHDICDAVWMEIIGGQGDEETHRIWKRQTGVDVNSRQTEMDTLFETYWVIAERKEGQEYGDWFAETESLLAARKRLRDFKAEEEPGEKSGISGEREILRREGTRREDIRNFWRALAATLSESDLDKEGDEHLDAIDLVKRFAMLAKGMPQKPFPSTSSIATASFIERLLATPIDSHILTTWREATSGKLVDLPIGATKAIPYLQQRKGEREWLLQRDGDLYFLETFTAYRLEKEYNITRDPKERAKNGQHALRQLLKAADEEHMSRPTPYYATIQMDGDNMGILLSGVEGETEHRNISATLSKFSREIAPPLVQDNYPGKLAYAGGDDLLAFAPLARDVAEADQPGNVLELVDMLQAKYRQEIIDTLPESLSEERLGGITASAGVVIAHHYTSLSYVLRSAREAESTAKKRYGRNALVVTLIRRSGEQTRVGCHWRYRELGSDTSLGQPIALFSRFYRLFKHDVLSPKCIYILLEEAPALVKMEIEEAQDSKKLSSAMQSEIKRILRRQRDNRREADFPDAEVDSYAWYLTRLAAAIDADAYPHLRNGESKSVELHSDSRRYGLIEVLGWLLAMAFLARKEQE